MRQKLSLDICCISVVEIDLNYLSKGFNFMLVFFFSLFDNPPLLPSMVPDKAIPMLVR